MAQSIIPRPSEARTLRSSYGSYQTDSLSAPVDTTINIANTRPVLPQNIVALVFIGFSPANSWTSEIICKEVLFDSDNFPYGFSIRTTGSTPQKYYIRYMWLYYS